MIGLTFKTAKAGFFDRAAVQSKVPPAERRILSRMGAITMREDRNSLKEAQGSAPPGQPPHVHVFRMATTTVRRGKKAGQQRTKKRFLYRDSILFALDLNRLSMVEGAVLLNGGDRRAPELIEKGGAVTRVVDGQARNFRYRPHPHTEPAFGRALKKLPGLLAGSIK